MGFDVIKSMVTAAEGAEETLTFHGSEIVRNKKMATLTNRDNHKTYSFHFKKGIVDDTLTVYPYGYLK